MSKSNNLQSRRKPKKSGRPALDVERKKTERLNVMATKEDRSIIEAKAQAQNVSISSFLLDVGLSKKIIPPPPAVNLKLMLELNRLGRNLNTLIVLLQKQRNFNLNSIEITIESLHSKINEVIAQLIGNDFYDEVAEIASTSSAFDDSNAV